MFHYRPLKPSVGQVDAIACLSLTVLKQRHHALAIYGRRFGDACQIAERGKDIATGYQCITALISQNARARQDQRDVDSTVIVQVLFAQQTVLAYRQSAVAGEDNNGVFQLVAFFQGLDQMPELTVQKCHSRIVVDDLLFNLSRITGTG